MFYLFTHKDDRQPTVGKDYNLLDDEDKISRKGVGKEGGTAKYRNQMQKISGKKEEMNIFEYSFEEDGKTKVFKWCTNILLTSKNIIMQLYLRWNPMVSKFEYKNGRCLFFGAAHTAEKNLQMLFRGV